MEQETIIKLTEIGANRHPRKGPAPELKIAPDISMEDPNMTNSQAEDQVFISKFERSILKTIQDYNLITKEDKILVAVSGGKDSTVILHVLNKLGFSVEAITVDAKIGCYTEKNLQNIRNITNNLRIKLHEISFIKEFGSSLCYLISLLESKGHNLKSCNVCGVLRRRLLNKRSRELGGTKLVTGHNMDDEAQVVMMNLFKGNIDLSMRMGPKSGLSAQPGFVQRVKPMYFTKEEDIVRYSKIMQFPVHYGKCPCSVTSFRYSIRQVFKNLEDQTKKNIINNSILINNRLKKLINKQDNTKQINTNLCIDCSEPCRNQLCQPCTILNKVASD
jgi:tRNA-5-methyluridine54 2-sulfurtransferase